MITFCAYLLPIPAVDKPVDCETDLSAFPLKLRSSHALSMYVDVEKRQKDSADGVLWLFTMIWEA